MATVEDLQLKSAKEKAFRDALFRGPEGPETGKPRSTPWAQVRLRIRPALKGRETFLIRDLYCPFRAMRFSRPIHFPGSALGWHVADLSGRDSRSEHQIELTGLLVRDQSLLRSIDAPSLYDLSVAA